MLFKSQIQFSNHTDTVKSHIKYKTQIVFKSHMPDLLVTDLDYLGTQIYGLAAIYKTQLSALYLYLMNIEHY